MNVLDSKFRKRQRVLNPRAAAVVTIVLSVLIYGTGKLHDQQFGKTVDFLRQAAYASLEAKDYRKAHVLLHQYLTFRSSDLDAREKLSSLLSGQIGTRSALEQAFHLNEELLRNDLPQPELRLEQARIAVRLGSFFDAEIHLRLLQVSREANGEVWCLSGNCAKEQRKTAEAVRCYQRAIACSMPPEQAFDELARLAITNPQLSLHSNDILDQMVATCNSAEAYRLRAMQFVEINDRAAALQDVWSGLALSSSDVALNALLVYCLETDRSASSPSDARHHSAEVARAIDHLQECVARNPFEVSFRVQHAALLWEDQQESAAIEVLESGIICNARAFQLHSILIEYLLTQEKIDKAERLLSDLPAKALSKAERELLSGRIQLLRKDWVLADASLQRAAAFSQTDSSVHRRAQVLRAICRSQSGNAATAVDAFRTVLSTNPDSVAGQLGLASAWIKSGRSDLAIAEYRNLLNVPGVPAYLADLLIQRNLDQPAGFRNWSEIANLVRDQDPFITDRDQRLLLQADLLMASGKITDAITHLESAVSANPASASLTHALARLNGELGDSLQHRLQHLANDHPKNPDIRAALVRLQLGAGHPEAATKLLQGIASGDDCPQLSSIESLILAIQAAEIVTSLETRCGRTQSIGPFQDETRRCAYQLVSQDSCCQHILMRVLAEQGRTDEALTHIRSSNLQLDSAAKAQALTALAEYGSLQPEVLPEVMRELFDMIQAAPDSSALRIFYADALLYGDHVATAKQVLEQIQDVPPDDGEVAARLAWILAVDSSDLKQAGDLIAHAIRIQPESPTFRVIEGRVLLSARRFEDALKSLSSLDQHHVSRAASTYRAAALLELGRTSEASGVIDQIRTLYGQPSMFPADERLLESIANSLNQFATASRVRP